MKLATLKNGSRDGRLVVVSRDLTRASEAGTVAPTLQAALDSPVRHDSREVTKGLLAMFDGRVRHHVFDLVHGTADA